MTHNLPTCFFFSDLPDSTELWEANEELMATCHRTYYTLIRNLGPQFSGIEIKNLGDGFFITFPSSLLGLRFCLHLQSQLSKITWPTSVVEFRTRKDEERGIPTKIGKGITTRLDFHGNAPNIAARVMAAANGDEIAVSDAVLLDIERLWDPAGGDQVLDRVLALEKVIRDEGLQNEFEVVRKGSTKLRGIKNPLYLMVVRLRR
ncbi:adenylyl cyclase [Acephala macrosclerotiorum]|nr:adenylyl cyclase [Acephala macrosclerotiorum]